MNNKANGILLMILGAIIIIVVVHLTWGITTCPDTTQKQHNFQVGDDTEHIWIGGNGDTIIE